MNTWFASEWYFQHVSKRNGNNGPANNNKTGIILLYIWTEQSLQMYWCQNTCLPTNYQIVSLQTVCLWIWVEKIGVIFITCATDWNFILKHDYINSLRCLLFEKGNDRNKNVRSFHTVFEPHIVCGHHMVFRLRKKDRSKHSHVGDLSRQTLRLFILCIHVSSVTILYIILI